MLQSAAALDEGLIDVVRAVFEPLELAVEGHTPPTAGRPAWVSTVKLTGGFDGLVEVWADAELMDAVCGLMLGKMPDAVTDRERDDAWGEVGNLVAGFVLRDLPHPIALAPPTVRQDTVPARPDALVRAGHARIEGLALSVLLRGDSNFDRGECNERGDRGR